ncbi:peptidase S41 [Polymorphobacter sp. PAMC 29334]|uniref:S41 family peptidase n=1 Tax=Polymorphobacter sp. PAMC 29334 TaxID=2862331 RepID=UPI001C7787D6|nr:S41 family peptidase [Polymorphobacter sp. PAMC 29334]QYE35224.1 peptidase S41 [Polymorphobacter sp. PAMC 29334]
MFSPDRRLVLGGIASAALTALVPSSARVSAGLLEPKAMRGDIAVLTDAFTSLHPGLYRYLTPAQFLAARKRLDLIAAKPLSRGDFYLALSAFTASIRCGHSYPNPSNQNPAITTLFDRADRLPFAFIWLDGRMIVTRDLGSGQRLAPGAEVVTIDGVDTRAMLARMLPYTRTDGSNEARKLADLGIPGDGDQPSFDILRTLLFPSAGRSAHLEVRTGGATRTIDCPLLSAAIRDAALNPKSPASPYGWRFETRGTVGVLTMPTWAVFHEKWDWQGFIDASIDTAIDTKLTGVVIDIRENGGGLDCGAAVLARLITAPLKTDNYSRHVRYRVIPDRLAPYLKTWDPSFRDWGASAIGPDANGFYTLDRPGDASDTDTITPAKRRFTGKVAVLTGPKNASATFGFAALIKQHRLATVIGEATGGNLRGINGGAFFFVNLPESGIEVDLPLIGYWPDRPQPDAGVTPDIVVPRRRADIAGARDLQMERAIAVASA